MPFPLRIFLPLACLFLLSILLYAPYEWGESLVQEEIALQELVPKNYTSTSMQQKAERERKEREGRISLLRQYFPVRERAWLWSPAKQTASAVREEDKVKVFIGDELIDKAVGRYKAAHPVQPFVEPEPEPTPTINPKTGWRISPEEFLAGVRARPLRDQKYRQYLASLPPPAVVISVSASRSLAGFQLAIECTLAIIAALGASVLTVRVGVNRALRREKGRSVVDRQSIL